MSNKTRAVQQKWESMKLLMDDLIPSEEAARRLGVARQHIALLLREEKIIGKRIGRAWIVYAPSLDAYNKIKSPMGRPRSRKIRTKDLS